MSDQCDERDTRVPSAFEIEQLLSEVRSFDHSPSLGIFNEQQNSQPATEEPSVLSAEPASLCFEFAHKSRAPITRTLRIHNMRGHKVKVYLAQPQSKHFTLRGDRVAYVYPGKPLSVEVTFTPCEPRHYGDEVRVDTPGEVGVVVDLEARPRCRHAAFPARIDLGTVSLGSSVERSLVIPPCADHDVKFTVLRDKWDCDLRVGPLWGVVRPSDEPRRVRIVFAPSAYVTALYELRVFVPTASLTPFRVAVAAVCVPGLPRDRLLRGLPVVPERPRKTSKQRSKFTATTPMARPKTATPGKRCHPEAHVQLGPFGRSMEQERAAYLAQCEQFVLDANALRADAWRVRVRDEIVRLGAAVVPPARQKASSEQKQLSFHHVKIASEDQSVYRETPRFSCQRTMRKSTQDEEKAATGWCSRANADFFVRYQILCKFIAAARRTVTTNRLLVRLKLLKERAKDTIAAEEAAEALGKPPMSLQEVPTTLASEAV